MKKLQKEQEMKELINKLIQWLEAEGISKNKIIECIKFITQ